MSACQEPLFLVQEIPLIDYESIEHRYPDGAPVAPQGRLDHFSYDPVHQTLFLACLGQNAVAVVDAFAGRLRSFITQGMKMPQGVLFVPQQSHHPGRLYVANAADGTVNAFEEVNEKWTLVGTVEFGEEADNLRYADGLVYVGYGEGAIGVIRDEGIARINRVDWDTLTEDEQQALEFLNECPCKAHPESFQLCTSSHRLYVNVADQRLVQVFDRVSGELEADWPLPEDLANNFPMALDEAGSTVFVGVRKPTSQACVLALDAKDGRCKARIMCAPDMDDLCFDPVRRRIYAVGGVGRVTVIDAVKLSAIGEVQTAIGARTGFFCRERDSLYVAAPATACVPARLLVFHGE